MNTNNLTLKKLDKVYSEENPSFFIKDLKKKFKISKLIDNRKEFLFKLKLTQKNFKNVELLDLGCGSGQNTIVFDSLGARCTMVEFNKNSYNNAKKLFKIYSKNKFKIFNKDLFDFKIKKKFDIVVSNGVAHHTYDVKKNIDLACKYVKKNGFIILGVCTPEGWFQRNLQRAILFQISNNKVEVIKNAKNLYSEHLLRSKKFGLRTINEIIFDTYVNPKINCISYENIKKIFQKNGIINFSSLNYDKRIDFFANPNYDQQKQSIVKGKKIREFNLSPIHEFSISNLKFEEKKFFEFFRIITLHLNKVVNQINDINNKSKIQLSTKNLSLLASKLKKGLKLDLINVPYNLNFINEIKKIYKILSSKQNNEIKISKLKKTLAKNKNLFKGSCGVGMNYFVGYKKR